jgi:prevent-host-death family protein
MQTVGAYEAKTHLPALLDRVAQGEQITITRHGVPVAVLTPPSGVRKGDVQAAIRDLLEFRKGHRLDGLSIRELIEEGRR